MNFIFSREFLWADAAFHSRIFGLKLRTNSLYMHPMSKWNQTKHKGERKKRLDFIVLHNTIFISWEFLIGFAPWQSYYCQILYDFKHMYPLVSVCGWLFLTYFNPCNVSQLTECRNMRIQLSCSRQVHKTFANCKTMSLFSSLVLEYLMFI